MKQIWKRSMSLLLSGVLLLSNVPLSALATEESPAPTETVVEEVQPVETELVGIQTLGLSTQQNVANSEITKTVYNVSINGAELNDETLSGSGYSYDKNETLTLTSAAFECVHSKGDLIIVLPENSVSTISKLKSDGNIAIQGKGKITVNEIVAGGDLTISANVEVGKEIQQDETPAAITVKNKIIIKDTETTSAHLVVRQAICFTDNSETTGQNNGVMGAGYYRTAAGGGFTKTETKIGDNFGEYFEFVTEKHLGEWVRTVDEHYKTCAVAPCPMTTTVQVEKEEHKKIADANCQSGAKCEICGVYTDKSVNDHVSTETEYKVDTQQGTHLLVHSCCKTPCEGEKAVRHEMEKVFFEPNQDALITRCKVCLTESERITIIAPAAENLVWNDQPKEAKTNPENSGTILYYNKDEVPEDGTGGTTEPPKEPGKYIAVLTEVSETERKPRVTFEIRKKDLADAMISKIENQGYLPGTEKRPEPFFTVTDSQISVDGQAKTLVRKSSDNTEYDYSVAYYRGENGDVLTDDTITPGKITVVVTASESSKYYRGTARTTYQITKADIPDDAFAPKLPEVGKNPVYDGTEKILKYTEKTSLLLENMEEPVVEFYTSAESTTPVKAVNAGTYVVKIRIPGNDYYNEKVLSNPEWKMTIDRANVEITGVCTEVVQTTQTVIPGLVEFKEPIFNGYTKDGTTQPDQLTETILYSYGSVVNTGVENVKHHIANNMSDGDTLEVKYVLKPKDSNYTGETTEKTITVTKQNISFRNDGKTVNPVELLKDKNTAITYGAADFISLDKLTAHVGDQTDAYDAAKQNFFVKYTGDNVEGEKNAPEVKYNKFTVYYSGILGGKTFTKVPVCGPQYLTVNKKTPVVTLADELEFLYNGQNQELEVAETDGGTLLYRIHGENTWKDKLTLKDAAVYWVYYKVVGDDNYSDKPEQKMTVVILPKLEARYGDKLSTMTLPAGWSWELNGKKLEELDVGPAGEYGSEEGKEDYQFTIAYNADKDSSQHPTADGVAVPVKILRKEVKIQVTLPETHYKLVKKSATVIGLEKTITPVVKYYKTATELEALPSAEYNVSRSLTDYPGHGEVTVTSKNVNYDFSEDSDLSESYIVYRPGAYSLSIVPDTLKSTYDDVSELKEALHNGLEKKHADADVTYYNVKMQEYDETVATNWRASDEELYCPENGFTFTLPYPTGEDENTEFELVGINTMKNASNRSVAKISFALKSGGIEFQMKNYAAVCLAWDGYNETDTYKVDTATSSYGTVKFTVGSDTTKKTSDDAVKVEEKINVFAEPNTNYAVTKVQYTYKDGSTTKAATIKQDDSGNYTFKMPAKDITIKVTFSKKTTSTKNPYSGDTSNIYLWLAILASSAVGIVALVIFWFKKRRK